MRNLPQNRSIKSRGENRQKGKTRELEQSKSNKRQQNIVGTQRSRAQHTRTGCNCVVRDWPQRIPAGIAWWMGLAMTTSHFPPPPPHMLFSLPLFSVATISPPSVPPFAPLLSPKPHSIQLLPSHKINLHSVHLVLVLCSDTMTYYSAQRTY